MGSATVPAPKAPPLRQAALAEIPKVNGRRPGASERIHDMIAERPDWCISRQRFWGVPLIIFYCEECNKRLEDFAALRHVLGLFEREGRRRLVTRTRAEELLPPGTRCAMRRRATGARKTTFSTSGLIPAPRISRCSIRRARPMPICLGRRICISKARTNIAAGSTARC